MAFGALLRKVMTWVSPKLDSRCRGFDAVNSAADTFATTGGLWRRSGVKASKEREAASGREVNAVNRRQIQQSGKDQRTLLPRWQRMRAAMFNGARAVGAANPGEDLQDVVVMEMLGRFQGTPADAHDSDLGEMVDRKVKVRC